MWFLSLVRSHSEKGHRNSAPRGTIYNCPYLSAPRGTVLVPHRQRGTVFAQKRLKTLFRINMITKEKTSLIQPFFRNGIPKKKFFLGMLFLCFHVFQDFKSFCLGMKSRNKMKTIPVTNAGSGDYLYQ